MVAARKLIDGGNDNQDAKPPALRGAILPGNSEQRPAAGDGRDKHQTEGGSGGKRQHA
jgi:hypothetical protein